VTSHDWQGVGLLAASVVRLHKLATLERTLVARVLGRLSTGDRVLVATAMRRVYGAW
jgi:mRNA interferase MazF